MLTTLQRMSKLSEKFQVRSALQWWFLIRGDEADFGTRSGVGSSTNANLMEAGTLS